MRDMDIQNRSERLIPASISDEIRLLHTVIMTPELLSQLAQLVRKDDFYRERHGLIWDVLIDLSKKHQSISFERLAQELTQRDEIENVGGQGYLEELRRAEPLDSRTVVATARAIREMATLRRIIAFAVETAQMPYKEDVGVRSILDNILTRLLVLYQDAYDEMSSFVLSSVLPKTLTPYYLSQVIAPYLTAMADFQSTLDQLLGRERLGVAIRMIRQYSPVSVSLEGAAEAVREIRDAVVPWRRRHAERLARLREEEMKAEIEEKRSLVLERQAHALKDRAEAEKLLAEAECVREQAARIRLENERLILELDRSSVDLALEIVAKLAPGLPDTDRVAYALRLLAPLRVFASSELWMVDPSEASGEQP